MSVTGLCDKKYLNIIYLKKEHICNTFSTKDLRVHANSLNWFLGNTNLVFLLLCRYNHKIVLSFPLKLFLYE